MNRQKAATVRRLKAAFTAFTCEVQGILAELEHANNVHSIAQPEVQACMEAVCEAYNVTIDRLPQKDRHANLAWARQVAMFLSVKKTRHNPQAVAQCFNRDRATVIHAVKAVEGRMSVDKRVKAEVEQLMSRL